VKKQFVTAGQISSTAGVTEDRVADEGKVIGRAVEDRAVGSVTWSVDNLQG